MKKRYQAYELLDVTNTKWARTFFTRLNGEISVHVFFTTMQPNITVGHIVSPKQIRQYMKKKKSISEVYLN